MSFALRKSDGDFDAAPMSDMNVTPLVDVMLVLLIVFMVAAPLMATGIPVNLPTAQAKPLSDQKPPIGVSIDAGGQFFVDAKPVAAEELITELKVNADSNDRRIHLRADKTLPYGKVVEVMALINGAGFSKVALVSEAPGTVSAKPATPAQPPTAP